MAECPPEVANTSSSLKIYDVSMLKPSEIEIVTTKCEKEVIGCLSYALVVSSS